MSHIAVFLAEGFEEIEGLTVVDLCRRAGIQTDMVSITEEKTVLGSHGIPVVADITFDEVDFDALDMIVLPGGLKGTQNLEACEALMEQVEKFHQAGRYLSAICAAPSIFGHKGYLKGREACSYPTFETHLDCAIIKHEPAVTCDHFITGRGMDAQLILHWLSLVAWRAKKWRTRLLHRWCITDKKIPKTSNIKPKCLLILASETSIVSREVFRTK